MSTLPEEVIADILSRLPPKPLLKFRSVSTLWRALIDRSDFISLHLNRSIETKTNLTLILRDTHLHSLDFDSLSVSAPVNSSKLDHHPLRCQDYGTEVWGSCNGLICLSNSLDTVVLWNPSTRKSRKLPYAAIEFQKLSRYYESRIYGFGYDTNSIDYKIVRIAALKCMDNNDSFDYETKVYSLKSNSWHRVEKFPHYPNLTRTCGVLASGALHWRVTEEPQVLKAGLIVAFDLSREDYRVVPQPRYSDTDFYMNVHGLGGCLSVLCDYCMSHVDIWIMEEYGVVESWNKLFSVAQQGVIRSSLQYVRPVAYSRSGGEVLLEQDARRLLWYDLKNESVKNVKIRGVEELLQVEVFVGSLVSLNSGCESDEKKKKELEEKNIGDFLSKGFKLVL